MFRLRSKEAKYEKVYATCMRTLAMLIMLTASMMLAMPSGTPATDPCALAPHASGAATVEPEPNGPGTYFRQDGDGVYCATISMTVSEGSDEICEIEYVLDTLRTVPGSFYYDIYLRYDGEDIITDADDAWGTGVRYYSGSNPGFSAHGETITAIVGIWDFQEGPGASVNLQVECPGS